MLSANVATVILFVVERSDMKMRYRRGPSTFPCGAPDLIGNKLEY